MLFRSRAERRNYFWTWRPGSAAISWAAIRSSWSRTENADHNILPSFALLKDLVKDNPEQTARVGEMKAAFEKWRKNAAYEIYLHDRKAPNANAYFNAGRGKFLFDTMRTLFNNFVNTEEMYRQERAEKSQAATNQASVLGALVTLAAGILLSILTYRQMSGLSSQYESRYQCGTAGTGTVQHNLVQYRGRGFGHGCPGRITLLNPVAETLLGWSRTEAQTKDSKIVFDIINETTRDVVESPVERVIRDGLVVGLANHTILRRRDGTEIGIDDSGAPIRDTSGKLTGVGSRLP